MIKIDNKEFRNLEEQVQYLTDYHAVNQGVAQWGIKVVDTIASVQDLPDPYNGEYGDAIAVGTKAPYFFYIWTRPSIEGGSAYWFPFGEISIVGPEGPKGDKGDPGPQGIRGSQWFSGGGQPATVSGFNVGDYYINVNTGNIWHLHDVEGTKTWLLEGNIIGPQGVQGPAGPQGEQGIPGPRGPQGPSGPVGPTVRFVGKLTSVDQLPDPSTIQPNDAYFVGTNVYIVIEGAWINVGQLGGSMVSSNGEFVSEFNADTKLDKVTDPTAWYIYGTKQGDQFMYEVSPIAIRSVIPMYDGNAQLSLSPNEPLSDNYAISKKWVNKYISNIDATNINKLTIGTGANNADLTITGGTTDKDFVQEVANEVFGDNALINSLIQFVTLNPSQANAEMSIAIGADNVSSAIGAITYGYDNTSSGWCSTAAGALNNTTGAVDLALGYKNDVSGNFGVAIGTENNVSKDGGVAIGNLCVANGKRSFALGNECETHNNYAVAIGGKCKAYGQRSVAMGNENTASLDYAFACGNGNKALGHASFVANEGNEAKNYAFAEGYNNKAYGDHCHAEGSTTIANGVSSHTEGWYTRTGTDAEGAHAEGLGTVANGVGAHAEGGPDSYTKNTDGTYTINGATTASGLYSHAEGKATQALHEASHAGGYGTITGRANQTVVGQYNKVSNKALFIVGDGSSDSNRTNILEVNDDGTATLNGEQITTQKPWTSVTITGTNGVTFDTAGTYEVYIQHLHNGLTGRTSLGIIEIDPNFDGTIDGPLCPLFDERGVYMSYSGKTRLLRIYVKAEDFNSIGINGLAAMTDDAQYILRYRRIY